MPRWLQSLTDTIYPPTADTTLRRIAYQPMLFVAIWIAAVIRFTLGTIGHVPFIENDGLGKGAELGLALALICPPLKLAATAMARSPCPRSQYCALWLGFIADIGVAVALTDYMIVCISASLSLAIVAASALFVYSLVVRDIYTMRAVERLARKLLHNGAERKNGFSGRRS